MTRLTKEDLSRLWEVAPKYLIVRRDIRDNDYSKPYYCLHSEWESYESAQKECDILVSAQTNKYDYFIYEATQYNR